MSDEENSIPKPSIPKPSIPKPSIPKPSIPKPTVAKAPSVKLSEESVEAEVPKVSEVTEEESSRPEEASRIKGVEVDLVKRFLGGLIDAIIAGVVAAIVEFITGVGILYYLVWAAVILTRDSLPMLDGQSVGKKVMKTKAVKEDGSSLSEDWATGAIRNILFAIPIVTLVEIVIIVMRSGKREAGLRFGDDWAKTKVVSVD